MNRMVKSFLFTAARCNMKKSVSRKTHTLSTGQSQQRSIQQVSYNVIPQPWKTASEEDKNQFNSMYHQIIQDVTDPYKSIPDLHTFYKHLLHNNLPEHKQAGGLFVVTAYKAFATPRYLTPEYLKLAYILGWCTDLLFCGWQIIDDLVDQSETRRGIPCWYRNPNVGLTSVNHAAYIENSCYTLLEKYVKDDSVYFDFTKLVKEMTLKVLAGQILDGMAVVDGKPQFQLFNMERFRFLGRHKGTYPEFVLPIRTGMLVAGANDLGLRNQIHSILFKLGDYFEAQNDILDVYGDPSITGKIGSDFKNGKCTWLVISAMEKGTKAQRDTIYNCYGKADNESCAKIAQVYEDLGLFKDYLKFEEETYNDIIKDVNKIERESIRDFMFKVVCSTYGREIEKPL